MKKVTLITLAVLLMFSMISCSLENEKKPCNNNELMSEIKAEVEIDLSVDRLNYSDLNLQLNTIAYDGDYGGKSDIIPEMFNEIMIMDSVIIVIGTVINIRYNNYFKNTKTVVFELRVDEILYSEKDIEVGDVVLIEHDLRYPSSLTDELVGLKLKGQYVLPIEEARDYIREWCFTPGTTWQDAIDRDLRIVSEAKLESKYNTVHLLMPPIQVVHNKYYLFSDEWESLITSEAAKVDVNIEMNYRNGWEERLYIRDDSLLEDFKEIISKYVNEEFRQEMYPTIPYIFKNGKVKMTNHLARQFEKTNLPADKLIIMNYICEKTVFGEWLLEYEVENRYLHFGKTKSSWVKYELGTEEKVISVVKGFFNENLSKYSKYAKSVMGDEDFIVISDYSRNENDDGSWIIKYTAMNEEESFTITVPEYAELATREQLIKNALEFMPPEYTDYSTSVELDEELGILRVYFSNDGEVKVIAVLGLFGLQHYYVICR